MIYYKINTYRFRDKVRSWVQLYRDGEKLAGFVAASAAESLDEAIDVANQWVSDMKSEFEMEQL